MHSVHNSKLAQHIWFKLLDFSSFSWSVTGLVSLQYFIGVTVLAMVPELPEIVNGIQFALQNNISLRFD